MDTAINREKIAQFGNIELLAKQVVEGFITGLHKSPFHGFSVEFAEHRLYNSGESTRHVDWKLYARTEKLFTKKYEEETNLRCQMVLDCSSSMLYQKSEAQLSKLEFSIYAIASLIELLKRQRDAVGISLFDDDLLLHSDAKSSTRHHRYIYAELAKQLKQYTFETAKKTNAVAALHAVAELTHKRSLIIVFSDMLENPEQQDELFQALQHLKHNKHEVVVFHVVDKVHELDFELENRPYTLVDMESGEKLKLQPSEVKATYQEEIQKYFKALADRCGAYRIDYQLVDVNAPLHAVLLAYLLKRQKMK